MGKLELIRNKKLIGSKAFSIFFPKEDKKLKQKQDIGKQSDLVLVSSGTQTNTVTYLRVFTGWTVKKATAFYKEGFLPKVVVYNIDPLLTIEDKRVIDLIEDAESDGVIFKIY